MMPELMIETTSRQIGRQGHIIEGVLVHMRCSQFERSMLVACDDTGRVRIYDGDRDHLYHSYESSVIAAREAAENMNVTEYLRHKRELELKRDVLFILHGTNATLTANGQQIGPTLPFRASSVLPFVQLWAGVIGQEQYHIVGHEDGEVSWFTYNELLQARAAYGTSTWPVIQHQVPANIHELVVPIPMPHGMVALRLPIRSYRTHLAHVYATFRAACDQQNGCWITASNMPDVQIYTPAKANIPVQLGATPVDEWPFNGVADFVQAAVDAARDMV